MESQRITIRIPDALLSACKRMAGSLSVGEWLRSLAEQATGVVVPMIPGVGGLPEKKRQQIARKAAKARWGT